MPLTIGQKKKALDRLYYEIWMFNESFSLLRNCSRSSNLLKNVYLECFLLHARNLIYFLENRGISSDVRCSDFGIIGVNINLPITNSREDINKYLAHLTQERILRQSPSWNCPRIKEEINSKLSDFLNALSLDLFPTEDERERENFERLIL